MDTPLIDFIREVNLIRNDMLHLIKTADADEQTCNAWRAIADRCTFTLRLAAQLFGDQNQLPLF